MTFTKPVKTKPKSTFCAADKQAKELLLIAAAIADDADEIINLLDAGCVVTARDEQGRTALHWGAIRNNITVCWTLVRHGLDINVRDSSGKTALHWAAMNGARTTIEYLLGHGASLKLTDAEGRTAADLALEFGYTDLGRELNELAQE
ncbi:MAG: ankyrin repeat domain-containing protein [Planctomycetia bacterium]|nr:ankyrin repeat domain-containing protein [Planctomycetia bacterium]